MNRAARFAAVAAMVLACVSGAQAEVVIEWVTVGHAGNAADTEVMSTDGTTGYGRLDYVYCIAKYEVTNGEYTEFLNAVAAVGDPNGLYHVAMGETFGGIVRTGSGTVGDPWVYAPKNPSTEPDWPIHPVNIIPFYDALRFANWMHNGQPGLDAPVPQNENSTENGAYDMSLGADVVRKDGARVFLTSEDEWYKAAYYKGGGTNTGYWDYATRTDTIPTREAPPGTDVTNGSANYYSGSGAAGYAVGPPYYTAQVGAYTYRPSDSAFGTFDQRKPLRVDRSADWVFARGARWWVWHSGRGRLARFLPAGV